MADLGPALVSGPRPAPLPVASLLVCSLSGHRGGSLTVQSGRWSRDHVASGPETSESSDSPVLPERNALVGLPHHCPPPPCASCSLWPGVGDVCVCVCVCAGSRPSWLQSRRGPGLCRFSVFLRASLCRLLFLHWFCVQCRGRGAAAPELGEGPSCVSPPCPGRPLGQRAHRPGRPVNALHGAV